MADIFVMKLDQIQPSQLFVSSEKLANILRDYDRLKPELLEPLPVKKLGNEVILTDCHTLALAAHLRGISEIRVYWDKEELDWDAYKICVDWCKKEGVHSVADLKDRVVSAKEFDLLWLKRCKEMVQDLEAQQAKISFSVKDMADQELIEPE
jgi:hypothetical protein